MTRNRMFGASLFAAAGACALLLAGSSEGRASTPTKITAQPKTDVFGYSAPDGQSYFAVTVRAEGKQPTQSAARDHVILVDTSASQTGAHRRQALAVVKNFLAALPAGDHVQLYAIDLKATALTSQFVAPQSAQISKAMTALNRRFPAGATDMETGIRSALKQFNKRPGSIVYIGDGMSTANLLQSEQLQSLMNDLTAKQIAVHTYAVGPRKDLQIPGMLAQRTGGRVLIDSGDEKKVNPRLGGS